MGNRKMTDNDNSNIYVMALKKDNAELTIIKGIGNSSPEMRNLKKEIDILKDDLRIKDLEMGKMMDKINGKKGNFRS